MSRVNHSGFVVRVHGMSSLLLSVWVNRVVCQRLLKTSPTIFYLFFCKFVVESFGQPRECVLSNFHVDFLSDVSLLTVFFVFNLKEDSD